MDKLGVRSVEKMGARKKKTSKLVYSKEKKNFFTSALTAYDKKGNHIAAGGILNWC